MRGKKKSLLVCLLLFVIVGTMCFGTGWMQTNKINEKIKIGFFEFDGYHMVDKDGKRSGYGYEYLQEMAKNNDWVYEYVGYEQSWAEMQEMLKNGEIDLLTSAQKTPEREELFDFSENPIGASSTIFTVKSGNMTYLPGDFENYDGIRVGMLEGNSRNESFAMYAKQHGFTYRPVYFENTEVLMEGLQAGDLIDAVITSNLRAVKNEWILAQFDASPFYVMVQKGNQELLDEVNATISQIKLYKSNLPDVLSEKYYKIDNGEQISFSPQERRYIKELQSQKVVLKAIMNPDRAPISYFVNGEPKGIMAAVFEELQIRTGLTFDIIETKSREDYLLKTNSKIADIVIDARLDYNSAEEKGFKLTEPYLDTSIVLLSQKDFDGVAERVAVVTDNDITEKYLNYIYKPHQLFYYNSLEECVDAVKKGRQDCTYLYTYSAQRFLVNDEKNQLKETLIPNYNTNFCLAVNNRMDSRLLTILDKAVKSMNKDYIREIVLEQTSDSKPEVSFTMYLYDNPTFFILLIGVFFVLIIIIILYIVSIHNRKFEKEKSEEFERFITYVCKANDEVLELDVNNKKGYKYKVEKGKLVQAESEIMPMEFLADKIDERDYKKIQELINFDNIQILTEEEKELTIEFRMRSSIGEYCWYSCTFQGIRANRKSSAKLMVFSRNIDAIKREEEHKKQALQDALEVARKASTAKGNFMSRMSHEIRTPLNAVIGYMSIAQEEEDKLKTKDYIIKASFAARHLLDIINDVLDISSIESGKMKIAKEDFNLKQLINNLTTIFYAQCKEKGIKLKVSLKDITEEWVVGDALRLNQVLMNLLSNAVKFTQEGGIIYLFVTQKNSDEHKHYLTISVEDTGVGMTKEFRGRLFTPFEQQDASIAQKYGGTGLGLSIAKNLVNMMNGTIAVDSVEGKGTTFTVSICFEHSEKNESVIKEEIDITKLQGIHVLLAEDNEMNLEIALSILGKVGIIIDSVRNGKEAVDCFLNAKEGTYSAILMDVQMPVMNGYEATKKIRLSKHPQAKDIPIIAMTANAFTEDIAEALASGMTDHVAKPINYQTLFACLIRPNNRQGD